MNFLKRLILEIKVYAKTPEMIALSTLLALATGLYAVNVFFLPTLLLKIITGIVFLGIGFGLLNGYVKLARLKIDSELKSRELKAVIENLKDGVIIYDPNFKIIGLNRGAEEIFGLEAKEVLGKYVTPAWVKEPRLRTLAQAIFPSLAPRAEQIGGEGWPQIVDLELESPKLSLRTTLSRITDEKGNVIGFLRLVRDETREKSIIESKGEFITVAAHQLRTPLTAIRWVFETIARGLGEKSELKEMVAEGLSLADRSLKIVNDLLDAAKIEEGRFGYVFEDIELEDLLEELIRETKPLIEQYGIKVNFLGFEKKHKIRGDKGRLTIVFSNLLDNAIRYNTEKGSVAISTEELKDRPFLKINVADTGVGIPPQDVPKLFQKFYRGKNVQQMEPNGSGLGLYIIKNIVKSHGGDIAVESELGRGTTFSVFLPLDPKLVPRKEVAY